MWDTVSGGDFQALCAQPWAGLSQGGQKMGTQVLQQGTGAFWARGQEGSVGGGLEPGDVRRPSCTVLPKAAGRASRVQVGSGATPGCESQLCTWAFTVSKTGQQGHSAGHGGSMCAILHPRQQAPASVVLTSGQG